jgi:hypothetical protein
MRCAPVIVATVFACAALLRGAEVSRVLSTFDFEERELGNDESLPMHWTKVQGEALPHYVNGLLSTDRHRSGRYSFRFDLNGGSLIYRYGGGRILVQRGAHYQVDAYCQTTPLPNARARLGAFLVDQDGHEIPGTRVHSRLYAASSEDVEWKKLSVEVTASAPEAASIAIELAVLQPELYRTVKSGERPLFAQDIRGSAWWDDVTVSQVPEVSLRTGKPGNVFARGEPVRVGILVSDRMTEDLAAQLTVRDAAGRVVYQRTGKPDLRRSDASNPTRGGMVLDIPAPKPGWYQALLNTSSGGHTLGAVSLNFVVLPDTNAPVPPDGRFGFVATHLPADVWGELPQVLPMLSAGRVKLAVWNEQGDVEQNHGAAFDALLNRFAELGISPTACLTAIPPQLADSIGSSDWKQLLKVPSKSWQPDLAFLVSRHANHLDRWQLGADGSAQFVNDPQMREVYRRVLREFSALMDKPDLAMPWPAWQELPAELPATVALDVPPSILPEQMPLYIQEIRGRSDHNLSLTIELIDRQKYGRTAQARDLAQRVIYALSAGAGRIDLPLPFDASKDRDGSSVEPLETLLIMRTIISTLSGAQYKGSVVLGDGIDAFLFDKNGRGILALWDRNGGASGKRELAINLGARPVSIDLWGNQAPLPRSLGDKAGKVSVTVGAMPMFLVDIDGPQAQLRASVAIDRPMLESSFVPHTRKIHFENSYPQAISGSMHIKAPAGWTLNPPTFNFNLNPGQAFEREVTVQFPYNSSAGAKTLECTFYVEGQSSSPFTVPVKLKLGLTDVGMQSMAQREGRDVFVQQIITNYGDKPISYNAFATYPSRARQERLVTDLAPGSTTVRRYRFENVQPVKGAKVHVGLKEFSGTRFLNDEEVEVR